MSVFGTISTNTPGPVTSYQVDDQPPTVFNPPVPAGVQHRQRFFHSGYLDPGQHVLVLTNIEDGDEVWVDYFEVEPEPQTISSYSMYSVVLTCPLFRSLPTGTSQSLPPASSSSTTETDSSLPHSQSPPTSTVPPTETSSSSTALADSSFPHLKSSLT